MFYVFGSALKKMRKREKLRLFICHVMLKYQLSLKVAKTSINVDIQLCH